MHMLYPQVTDGILERTVTTTKVLNSNNEILIVYFQILEQSSSILLIYTLSFILSG